MAYALINITILKTDEKPHFDCQCHGHDTIAGVGAGRSNVIEYCTTVTNMLLVRGCFDFLI